MRFKSQLLVYASPLPSQIVRALFMTTGGIKTLNVQGFVELMSDISSQLISPLTNTGRCQCYLGHVLTPDEQVFVIKPNFMLILGHFNLQNPFLLFTTLSRK